MFIVQEIQPNLRVSCYCFLTFSCIFQNLCESRGKKNWVQASPQRI